MKYSVDSRNVMEPSNTIFYALVGENNNGHDFVVALYNKGVRNFVLSERREEYLSLEGASVRYVENTLATLQEDARLFSQGITAQKVAITGSNGKTVVKEWIAQLMEGDLKLCRSPRSYNSQVGVPLSILGFDSDCKVALVEAGISLPGEMAKLREIIDPEVVIFTHFGDAHSEGFESDSQKLYEKSLLFTECKVAIAHKDRYGEYIASVLPKNGKMIFWSEEPGSDIQVKTTGVGNVWRRVEVTEYITDPKGVTSQMEIPFADEASYENCMTAIIYLLYRSYPLEVIGQRVKNLQPVEMRMEIKEGVNGSILIKDYYNSDLASFSLAVRSLSVHGGDREKVVILSDFEGVKDELYYQEIAKLLSSEKVDILYCIGPKLSANKHLFRVIPSTVFYSNVEEFLRGEKRKCFSNRIVLIKGARKYRFERIGEFLQKLSHTTTLEVNLNAIAHNFNTFKKKVAPGTRIAVMVKALSYGAGLAEVANMLQYQGADYLMVAYTDEGVELRNKGITVPIAVMNPERESFETMVEFSLEPEIYSMELLQTFENYLDLSQISSYPIHLKFNTGMNRSGLNRDEIPMLLNFFKERLRRARIVSLFSHLATADQECFDDFTLEQISRFKGCTEEVLPHFEHKILRHILNSAGIERFPEYCFDMVRLGIGLYGFGNDPNLESISTFKTHITSLRNVSPSESVGYGRKGRLERESRIATIPVGYADGIDRHLGCGVGEMFVCGKRVPVVGNVCMDICMLDVTDCEGVKVGAEVEIFGKNISVSEIASKLGTIEYEILTSVSPRVKRVYFHE